MGTKRTKFAAGDVVWAVRQAYGEGPGVVRFIQNGFYSVAWPEPDQALVMATAGYYPASWLRKARPEDDARVAELAGWSVEARALEAAREAA